MSFKFNPLTGLLDLVDIFNPDKILTSQFFEVLIDNNGNVLVGL